MAKNYTDALKIGDYLGRTLTAQEYAQATQLVDAVEAYIDRRTGRAWLNGTTVTDELHIIAGTYLYLTQRPVTAITAIEVRRVETDDDTVVDASDYVLVDATTGLVALPWAYHGYRARITYTHAGPPLPADLALAATMLGAHWLGSGGGGEGGVGADVQSYSVGQELTVTRFESANPNTTAVPAEVTHLLAGYRAAAVVFA